MTDGPDDDPELADIRARRLQAILAEHSAGPTRARLPAQPVAFTSTSLPSFLAEHPRVVIDVWAVWCGPCRAMTPVLDALARELAGEVHFGKVNADEEPTLVARWNVEGIPTLLVFENARLVDRIVGAYPHDTLDRRLRSIYRLGQRPVAEEME